jgi:cell division septum initiation protein DivIVA
MSDQNTQPSFQIVRRGYEPTDVNRHIAELLKETGQHQQRIAELTGKVRELEAARELAQEQSETPPTFGDFGKRVGDILALAEEEATEIRSHAESDVDAIRREAQAEAQRTRSEADQYSRLRRAEADEEAEGIVAAAHKRADELAEETQRESAARRQEADALFENQQAAAAQAAADIE